jgi:hypothetical protein
MHGTEIFHLSHMHDSSQFKLQEALFYGMLNGTKLHCDRGWALSVPLSAPHILHFGVTTPLKFM